MEVKEPFVFQADSDIVNEYYTSHKNYLIEYNSEIIKEYCIIYFSSNDLYYPNTEIAFKESIVQKRRFEWYFNRVTFGHKHIFIRDIKKQWYLEGINSTLNHPQKLYEFLKEETKDYKVILLGSSAGGFISVIMGQMLNAERIYSFNGQFEIRSILKSKKAQMFDPILYRNQNSNLHKPFYDSLNFITNPSKIYYFHSNESQWDIEQYGHVKHIDLNVIKFKTNNHGIPFLKSNLPKVLSFSLEELNELSGKLYHPVFFSLKLVGFLKTIEGVLSIFNFVLNKIYIRTFQRW